MPFFVARWPCSVRQVCPVAGLPPVAAPGRCARSQDLATVRRPAQAQRAAEPNGWRGGGSALAPHFKPLGVYFLLVLPDGRGAQVASSEVRAHAPHQPSRARSDRHLSYRLLRHAFANFSPSCTLRLPLSARPWACSRPRTRLARRPRCARVPRTRVLVGGSFSSYLECSCGWSR